MTEEKAEPVRCHNDAEQLLIECVLLTEGKECEEESAKQKEGVKNRNTQRYGKVVEVISWDEKVLMEEELDMGDKEEGEVNKESESGRSVEHCVEEGLRHPTAAE